ncbi:MAG: OmpA family protein [Sphingobacteriaceae bacterium]|nr:OmpA family protein [Sphingobacteriaceae bacterium]
MKKIIIKLLLSFSFLILIFFGSCVKKIITIQKGDKAYEKGNYYEARNYYEKATQIDSASYYANLKMGLILIEDLNEIDESLPYLQRAVRHRRKKDTIPDILKAFGDYCFYAGAYNKAQKFYKNIDDVIIDNGIRSDVDHRVENIGFALSHPDKNKKSIATIMNLGYQVNSYFAEYNSVFDHNEKRFYYTARRPENTGFSCDKWDGKYFEDMYVAEHINRFNFSEAENFTKHAHEVSQIKNTKKHDAVVAISDNDSILFSFKNNLIYISKFENGNWTEPEKMDKKVNKGKYQNHISISPDNKNIYYSSNKRGGYGGLDLYAIHLQNDNTWTKPINLGPEINTPEDEESVEILHDNKTILFASKGLPGYGGYDMFMIKKEGQDAYSQPVNLGPQINSPSDDIYMKLDSTMTEGFISSSRRGGYGDMDIYRFYFLNKPNFNKCNSNIAELDSILNQSISSKIKLNDSAKIDVSGIKEIYSHPVLYYFWKFDNQILQCDTSFNYITADKKGVHQLDLQFVAQCDTCYERLTYCFSKSLTVYDKEISDTLEEKPIDPLASITLNPIYFYFNKFNIRNDAKPVLNENIVQLLKHENARIKIYAHCDSRGSHQYNLMLAAKRAEAAVNYLLKNNIPRERIVALIPLGEQEIKNGCGDGVKCSEKEHQLNRRVDFQLESINLKD